ncbi:MAG: c-type cytochrome biogenesis protein CcmI [Betaproteobacteria bacterium]
MIAFILIAAAMVAMALAWVLVPLLKRRMQQGVDRERMNVAILRDQMSELNADLVSGTLAREQYDEARRELEQRVLEDSKVVAGAARAPSQSAAWTAAILAGTIPIVALLLYVTLGNHEAFAPQAERAAKGGADHEVTREQVEGMAAKLAAKLEKDPGNADGWVMLARTYYALNRYADAASAFDKAIALVPDDAGLLADYADAVGAAQGGLRGKALELVDRALKADSTQWKALALAGTAAFERKDYLQAVAYWEKMKATVPPGSPMAGSIDASIAEARELGGLKGSPAPSAIAAAPAATVPKAPVAAPATGTAPAASIGGTVSLAPALAAKASPTDTVFIFARAAEGPKMPLAILRKQVKDLPVAFTLDDSMAMAPNFALSNFASIVVGARVSKSGNAVPQSGDLEGFSPAVTVGARGLAVVIERALP